MGTRADFYVGTGPDMEWIGSTAFDGYPDGVFATKAGPIPAESDYLPFAPQNEDHWRTAVARRLANRDDSTEVERGWPWPWETSATTDYAYAWDPEGKRVLGSCFGRQWFEVTRRTIEENGPGWDEDRGEAVDTGLDTPMFPDMSDRKNVRYDKGSGALFLGFSGEVGLS